MKFPETPPPWLPLFTGAAQEGNLKAFTDSGRKEGLRADRYLHWDDFRHRSGDQDGLSKELRWAALRMSRAFRAQPIPLEDGKGNPFTFFLTQRAFEILREIDLHCGGGIGVAEEGIVQKDTRDRYYIDSITEEALTSSQLAAAADSIAGAADPPGSDGGHLGKFRG